MLFLVHDWWHKNGTKIWKIASLSPFSTKKIRWNHLQRKHKTVITIPIVIKNEKVPTILATCLGLLALGKLWNIGWSWWMTVNAVGSEGSSGKWMVFDNFRAIFAIFEVCWGGFCNCCSMIFRTQGGISFSAASWVSISCLKSGADLKLVIWSLVRVRIWQLLFLCVYVAR